MYFPAESVIVPLPEVFTTLTYSIGVFFEISYTVPLTVINCEKTEFEIVIKSRKLKNI